MVNDNIFLTTIILETGIVAPAYDIVVIGKAVTSAIKLIVV